MSLSIVNQNKFLEHLGRELRRYPHAPLMTISLQADFTFGKLNGTIEDNTLTFYVDGIQCSISKKENQTNQLSRFRGYCLFIGFSLSSS